MVIGVTAVNDGLCQTPFMSCSMCLSALSSLHTLLRHQLPTGVTFQCLLFLAFCPWSSLTPQSGRSRGALSILMFVLPWTYRGRQHPWVSLGQWGMESVDIPSFPPSIQWMILRCILHSSSRITVGLSPFTHSVTSSSLPWLSHFSCLSFHLVIPLP